MEQLNDVHNENRRQTSEKLGFYEEKIKEFSMQIHSLNEEKLLLLKEHEIMKAKLRTFEIDSTLNRGNGTNGTSAMFIDKIRGKLKSCQIHPLLHWPIPQNAQFVSLRQAKISEWKTKKVNYSIIRIWMS